MKVLIKRLLLQLLQKRPYGEVLWSGSFYSATGNSITFDRKGYRYFMMRTNEGVPMFGSEAWGGGLIGGYTTLTGGTYYYRYTTSTSGEIVTLSVDNINRGCGNNEAGAKSLVMIIGIA